VDLVTQLFPWITNGPLITVQVMSGLSVGMFLFLVSVGMSLIFGVTRIVNLAHGSFYMVGAYLMVTLVEILPERPWAFWVALLVAPLGVAVLGGVILGVLDNLSAAYISSQYRGAFPLIILIAVILFRPQGLLGRIEERTV